MKQALPIALLILLIFSPRNLYAQPWTEGFSNVLPTGWALINDGHTVSNTIPYNPQLTANAFVPYLNYVGIYPVGYSMLTTSSFTPAAKADRWLVTKSFQVSSPTTLFFWTDKSGGAPAEQLQVLLSPTAGTTANSFTNSLYSGPTGLSGFTPHVLRLGAYYGQTVRLAFRDSVTNGSYLLIDSAAAIAAAASDGAILSATPGQDDLAANPATGGTVDFTLSPKNVGYSDLASYDVKAQIAGGAVQTLHVTTTGTITPYAQGPISTISVTAPSSPGRYIAKLWIEVPNDANHLNDTFTTIITAHSPNNLPKKRLTFEEGTGTWCGYCPRGIVFMDSMAKMHPDNTSIIVIHNDDSMQNKVYDRYLTDTIRNTYGFPYLRIDRRELMDPYYVFDAYQQENSYYAYAAVTIDHVTYAGNNITVPVKVTPAANMAGDYRLALVLTEDRVHKLDSNYRQRNYFGIGQSNHSVTMRSSEYDFNNQPEYVPAGIMYYDHVARTIYPSATGAAGSLPSSMATGTSYNYTFTVPVQAGWDTSKLNVVVELIAMSNGNILNSAIPHGTLGVSTLSAANVDWSVYPNPARSVAKVQVQLVRQSDLSIQVIDMAGRTVYRIPPTQHEAGSVLMSIPLAGLSDGLYTIRLQTGARVATKRISVIK